MPDSDGLTTRLHNAIDRIAVVDTHEHIPDPGTIADRRSNFFHFFEHYVSSDLVSAGLSQAALDAVRDMSNGLRLEHRWAILAPYWPYVRSTGYGRAMREYMSDLFGAGEFDVATVRELSQRIEQAHKDPGWYKIVLEEIKRIE